ncbi:MULTISPECIES: type II toxin-antitoxin system RelE/ParE family toxin [unclassified Methylobacterium]|jgi:addiction module RelE/StbE family toxin|uniref:type II toxin-antitoxin system RelE/ParE family toxin n=1 Tax=unclassified Methylobacterium TaxID=2615210 RepID=UPI0013540BB9|nr:type II toxin-antitoxin system RelE/ParE family toxin [Methylobacterium sp. 2A]MWV23400.1 type II toxin-antitoxin system RelE/ParE family toxin [Methylobacterium sp. 2A]
MKALVWTLEALQDRDAIYDDIEADNPAAAIALDRRFTEKAARLVDHPALGRRGRVAGTREMIVHRRYIIVYKVDDSVVRILRVLHAALQGPPWSR